MLTFPLVSLSLCEWERDEWHVILFGSAIFLLLTFIPLVFRAFPPPAPTAAHSVICKHHDPQRLLPGLVYQPVPITTANKKEPICHSYHTPHHCLSPSSYTSCTALTSFSATPDFLMQYHSSSRGTLSSAFSRSIKPRCRYIINNLKANRTIFTFFLYSFTSSQHPSLSNNNSWCPAVRTQCCPLSLLSSWETTAGVGVG